MISRKMLGLAVCSFSFVSLAGVAVAQTAATQPTTVRGVRPEKIAEGTTEVIAEMRDKAKLAGNLYLPSGSGPFPCVVTRTPYGKDAMFANPAAAKRYTD